MTDQERTPNHNQFTKTMISIFREKRERKILASVSNYNKDTGNLGRGKICDGHGEMGHPNIHCNETYIEHNFNKREPFKLIMFP